MSETVPTMPTADDFHSPPPAPAPQPEQHTEHEGLTLPTAGSYRNAAADALQTAADYLLALFAGAQRWIHHAKADDPLVTAAVKMAHEDHPDAKDALDPQAVLSTAIDKSSQTLEHAEEVAPGTKPHGT